MSLIRSLFSGVSGLSVHQTMMDIIGNNIANVNSIGYKSSRVTFADSFYQYSRFGSEPLATRGGTNAFQVGLGVQVNSIDRNWSQGAFETTGIATDLGVEGEGMFILKRGDQTLYSRAGNFNLDEQGYLVNPFNGMRVQGKTAVDTSGNIQAIPPGNKTEDIKIDPFLRIPAKATTFTDWGGNLKSDSALTRTQSYVQTGNLDSTQPIGTAFTETNTIYDEDGNPYSFRTTYTSTGTNAYDMTWDLLDSTNAVISSSTTAAAVLFDPATGAMTSLDGVTPPAAISIAPTAYPGINFSFDPSKVIEDTNLSTLTSLVDAGREPTIVSGSLTIYDSLGQTHSLTLKFTKIADNTWKWDASLPSTSGILNDGSGTITFNPNGSIATPTTAPSVTFVPSSGADPQAVQIDFGTGYNGITQTSAISSLSNLTQNGSPTATLEDLNVNQYGQIIGIFSNGTSSPLAQVMVATFPNRSALVAVGENLYNQAPNSGVPFIAEPGLTSNSFIRSGYLEQSNVDLSGEFTKMIIAQRGFQANARVITTSDNIIQEITNLIR